MQRARELQPDYPWSNTRPEDWTRARDVVTAENQRIANLPPEALAKEAEAAGIATDGLSRGRILTQLMRAKTFGVPAAAVAGTGLLLSGGNSADAAPRGNEESMPHYLARRAYPFASTAADIGSYAVPYVGEARMGADVGAAIGGAANGQQAPLFPPAPRRVNSDVPPLPPEVAGSDAAVGPRMAHEREVQALQNARAEDFRQRRELEYRQQGANAGNLNRGEPAQFDAALMRLKAALEAARSLRGAPPAPANALVR
jgi:hypothetical protein